MPKVPTTLQQSSRRLPPPCSPKQTRLPPPSRYSHSRTSFTAYVGSAGPPTCQGWPLRDALQPFDDGDRGSAVCCNAATSGDVAHPTLKPTLAVDYVGTIVSHLTVHLPAAGNCYVVDYVNVPPNNCLWVSISVFTNVMNGNESFYLLYSQQKETLMMQVHVYINIVCLFPRKCYS
ncbi:hypothetical protein PAHAL_9G239300 [Panicum hallii]|uniref:Uncharacterized protein n=1 Tax=Panicum hallii TaxID=206008 RepID=A0A2T8I2B1_9POAL|nr:hypothetical protein PAHAL_9G239300 [Panicum hallii]